MKKALHSESLQGGAFRMKRAEKGDAPPGITHVGVIRIPTGDEYAIHARVVERGKAREFVGSVYACEGADFGDEPQAA